ALRDHVHARARVPLGEDDVPGPIGLRFLPQEHVEPRHRCRLLVAPLARAANHAVGRPVCPLDEPDTLPRGRYGSVTPSRTLAPLTCGGRGTARRSMIVGTTSNALRTPYAPGLTPSAATYATPSPPEWPPVRRYGAGPTMPSVGCSKASGAPRQVTTTSA